MPNIDRLYSVGFIGCGNIGLPLARRLLDGGTALVVHDVRPDAVGALTNAGARAAASAKEVADVCTVAFVSLPTIEALEDVTVGSNGLLHGSTIEVVVNTGTVGRSVTERLDQKLSSAGITFIDCPISGGPSGAAAGTLSVMVSGTPAVIEMLRPLLSRWGSTITVAGERAGAAQVLKLSNNILSAVCIAASAEVFVMGTKAGVDPEVLLAAINAGSGRNGATLDKFPRTVLTRTFAHGSALAITGKDVDLAAELGEEVEVPMWVCQAARLLFKHAIYERGGAEDVMNIVRHVERAAGFEIPKTR
jgi:2-hydroxy-3-oxopropionate reductase